MSITVNGQEAVPGVVPGGSAPNGHYVSVAVIRTALDFGWDEYADDVERAAAEYADHYWDAGWEFFDHWVELTIAAEDWLNSVTEGGYWEYTDGDFRLIQPTEMVGRRSTLGTNWVMECPECGSVCACWDVEDLDEDGRLMCWHYDVS